MGSHRGRQEAAGIGDARAAAVTGASVAQEPVIRTEALTRSFQMGSTTVHALRGG
jgi:hypothetical protein